MEKSKKIKLSLVTARYLFPVVLNPARLAQEVFAQKLMQSMMKNNR
jgi:hypothetical protein